MAQMVVQEAPQVTPTTNPYGSGLGMGIALNNSGFGINGFYNRALSPTTSLTAEISLRSEKDEQEQKYFDWFGNSIIPYKYNYMLMVPIEVGVQKRLFAASIDDSFRPYFQLSGGPTLGYVYPYFNDQNENQAWDNNERIYDSIGSLFKGHAEMGLGGTIALGAQFGKSRKNLQAVRMGYNFQYFYNEIELLEPTFKEGKKFFGTPTITIIFGKIK